MSSILPNDYIQRAADLCRAWKGYAAAKGGEKKALKELSSNEKKTLEVAQEILQKKGIDAHLLDTTLGAEHQGLMEKLKGVKIDQSSQGRAAQTLHKVKEFFAALWGFFIPKTLHYTPQQLANIASHRIFHQANGLAIESLTDSQREQLFILLSEVDKTYGNNAPPQSLVNQLVIPLFGHRELSLAREGVSKGELRKQVRDLTADLPMDIDHEQEKILHKALEQYFFGGPGASRRIQENPTDREAIKQVIAHAVDEMAGQKIRSKGYWDDLEQKIVFALLGPEGGFEALIAALLSPDSRKSFLAER